MSVYAEYMTYTILAFAIARATVAFGFKSGREYFRGTTPKSELDGFVAERTNNLVLAGLSLVALTLFLTIGSIKEDSAESLSVRETTFFLSISLVCFIVAASIFPIATERYFSYIANSLEWLGLLTIGIGMLLFFINNFSDVIDLQIVYWFFFAIILGLAALEISFYRGFLRQNTHGVGHK